MVLMVDIGEGRCGWVRARKNDDYMLSLGRTLRVPGNNVRKKRQVFLPCERVEGRWERGWEGEERERGRERASEHNILLGTIVCSINFEVVPCSIIVLLSVSL